MTLPAGASIEIVWAELVKLEKIVAEAIDTDVRVYDIRPDGDIQLPCIYNWMQPTRTRIPDTAFATDDFVIEATIAVRGGHTEDVPALRQYADTFREIVTPALLGGFGTNPLNGATRRAQINRWGTVSERFNEIPVLGIQFDVGLELNMAIHPE